MKVILLNGRAANARAVTLNSRSLLIGAAAVALLIGTGFGIGYGAARWTAGAGGVTEVDSLARSVQAQRTELEAARRAAMDQINALALRMGELQANVIRLNALGRRVTEVAQLGDGEFDFESPPGLGGPEEGAEGPAYGQVADLVTELDTLDRQLRGQEQQLLALQTLLSHRSVRDRSQPRGRPVQSGWISSYFGRRTDPFTGKAAQHRGMDFAGLRNTEIVAVGAGVVTWSGKRSGFGNLVEINHGNGYVTRYGHNQANLVAVGDYVKPGQAIALMGSSGRSTGPHLHFEVLLNGRAVNPLKYIHENT